MKSVVLKKIVPHIIAILAIVLINSLYFLPQFEGKVMQQSDVTVYKGMSKELKDYKQKSGEEILWTNAMFGGMPSYQISNTAKGNLLGKVDRLYLSLIHI